MKTYTEFSCKIQSRHLCFYLSVGATQTPTGYYFLFAIQAFPPSRAIAMFYRNEIEKECRQSYMLQPLDVMLNVHKTQDSRENMCKIWLRQKSAKIARF
jgi:hypothetical protein